MISPKRSLPAQRYFRDRNPAFTADQSHNQCEFEPMFQPVVARQGALDAREIATPLPTPRDSSANLRDIHPTLYNPRHDNPPPFGTRSTPTPAPSLSTNIRATLHPLVRGTMPLHIKAPHWPSFPHVRYPLRMQSAHPADLPQPRPAFARRFWAQRSPQVAQPRMVAAAWATDRQPEQGSAEQSWSQGLAQPVSAVPSRVDRMARDQDGCLRRRMGTARWLRH